MNELLWITNHPKSIKGLWPRRDGVEYIEGEPMATHVYTTDDLKRQRLIGVYVDMPANEYYKLPLIMSPKKQNR
jgi:hypothetical protein